MAKNKKFVLAVDFDGVINSFKSGWSGIGNIPDKPTDGAIDWLTKIINNPNFEVQIFSARNKVDYDLEAMKKWLLKNGLTKHELNKISFPVLKPSCNLLIDDRAVNFNGKFPCAKKLLNFKPWHNMSIWGGKEN